MLITLLLYIPLGLFNFLIALLPMRTDLPTNIVEAIVYLATSTAAFNGVFPILEAIAVISFIVGFELTIFTWHMTYKIATIIRIVK